MKIMTVLLMIFLGSCRSAPSIPPQISCDVRLAHAGNDLYEGRCLCRCLDLKKIESPLLDFSYCDGRYSGDSVAFSLSACDKLVGFRLKDYAEQIRHWLIESKEYCQDK
jgi:hypothetical protein